MDIKFIVFKITAKRVLLNRSKKQMLQTIKTAILKSKELTVPFYIFTNFGLCISSKILPNKISRSARTTTAMDVKEEISKFEREWETYLRHLDPGDIRGKNILEIGTGANLLVALKLIANGAKKIVSIDKYACIRPFRDQHKLYLAFIETLSDQERKILEEVLVIDSKTFEINPNKISYLQTDVLSFEPVEKFDLILSYAVFEHINDSKRLIESVSSKMSAQAKLVSLVGNEDHGMFSLHHDALQYYYVPGTIWTLMTANSARPNRKTPSQYSKLLVENGLSGKIYVRSLKKHPGFIQPPVPIENVRDFCKKEVLDEVSANKQKFSKEFRHLPEEDLLVSHFILVAEKTSNPQ